MHETGIEPYFCLRDGKKLRFGFTTGTCAAAAAKAATKMLVTGTVPETVDILTPKGIPLNLEILYPKREALSASCAVQKFSGDDPDVTNGILIYAEARWTQEPGISIDGGIGVGRVTKPGLKQAVGEAAINPVPRQMILEAAREALDDLPQAPGLSIVISIPQGVELAKKTFNPRLGIEGGISVLGTSGIVEPMSEAALIDSIRLEMRQKHALGCNRLVITPGNYGADFIRATVPVPDSQMVKCSNFIGQAIDLAAEIGYAQVLFVSHIGKFIKVAGGIMNTHSKEADCRADVMASCALRAGADGDTAREILNCITTDQMLDVLEGKGLLSQTMAVAAEKIQFYLNCRAKEQVELCALVFSNERGLLCSTGPALQWLQEMKKENAQ